MRREEFTSREEVMIALKCVYICPNFFTPGMRETYCHQVLSPTALDHPSFPEFQCFVKSTSHDTAAGPIQHIDAHNLPLVALQH